MLAEEGEDMRTLTDLRRVVEEMREEAENISPMDGHSKGKAGNAPALRKWAKRIEKAEADLTAQVAVMAEALGPFADKGRSTIATADGSYPFTEYRDAIAALANLPARAKAMLEGRAKMINLLKKCANRLEPGWPYFTCEIDELLVDLQPKEEG